jgi:acetolactate synthase-1/2/3 large subunit
MADAYARASGRLGVCTVHQGPGATNALTGLTEAAKSRTPLLLLAAEATAPRSNFFIDASGLAQASGAVHLHLSSAGAAVAETIEAARMAVEERRTVLLTLPLEIQAAECEPPEGVTVISAADGPAPQAGEVESLAAMLRAARRPI